MKRSNLKLFGLLVALFAFVTLLASCSMLNPKVTMHIQGSEVQVVDATYGEKFELPELENRDLYLFEGWYDNAEYTGEAIDFVIVGENTHVWAKWHLLTNVTGIRVESNPTKVAYKAFEQFNPEGLVVYATCEDGNEYQISNNLLSFDKSTLVVKDEKVVVSWEEYSAEIEVEVEKADFDLSGIRFADRKVVYNGEEHTLVYTGVLPKGVSAEVQGSAVNASATPYEIKLVFSVEDEENYNVPESLTALLTIDQATFDVSGISFVDKIVSYNGKEQTIGYEGNLPEGVTATLSNHEQTEAGKYTAVLSFEHENPNYKEIPNKTAQLIIEKANYDMSNVKWNYTSPLTYNTKEQSVSIDETTLPEGVSVKEYVGAAGTDAQAYEANATFNYDTKNYNEPKLAAPLAWTIIPAVPTFEFEGLTAVYGGTVGDIELPELTYGTLEWANPKESLSVGTWIRSVVFTSTSSNYVDTIVSAEFEITPATVEFEAELEAVYGQTLANVKLPESANGTWSWVEETTTSVGNAGANTFHVSFKANSANFNDIANLEVNLEVAAKEITATASTTSKVLPGLNLTWSYEYEGLVGKDTIDDSKVVVSYYNESGSKVTKGAWGATYTAKFTGFVNDNYEVICESSVTVVESITIAEAKELADNTEVRITATVHFIDSAWNTSYSNMDITIKDETGTLSVYRTSTQVAYGDIITITGKISTYSGNRQIAQGATSKKVGHDTNYDVPVEATLKEAAELSDGAKVIVQGIVSRIDVEYSSSYNNISVYIIDENGDELYLYRLSGNVSLKQTIKVTGTMATYNNSRQVTNGKFEYLGTHECTEFSNATCSNPAYCLVCKLNKDDILADHAFENGVCTVCHSFEGETVETVSVRGTNGALAGDKLSISWLSTSGDIKITNFKNTSSTAIRNSDSAHFRSYVGNKFVIEGSNSNIKIIKVVITCISGYVLQSADVKTAGVTTTINGTTATITVSGSSLEEFTINTSKQWRLSQIVVHYQDLEVKPTQLATPENVEVTEGAVSFDSVENAASYKAFVYNGEELVHEQVVANGDAINYAVPGTYNVKVQAIGDEETYLDSALSNAVVWVIEEEKEPEPEPEPSEPELVATFDFGANGSASHVDGNNLGASKTYTEDGYTLALSSMTNVYGPSYDAKGNSCIKLGTSSKTGTFTFTVPEDVTTVVIYVAKYKTNATNITVNGGAAQTLTKNSNNGEYDAITIDTTSNKTITFATATGGVRAMVNKVEYYAIVENGSSEELTDEQKVDAALENIALGVESTKVDFDLPNESSHETTITWTVKAGTGIVIEGYKAKVSRGAIDSTVTLTATITSGSVSKTKDFEVVVLATAKVVTLSVAKTLADGTDVIIENAIVHEIDTEYSSDFDNISVVLKDASGELLAYRLKGNWVLGDILTVTGTIGSYNSSKQIAQGATAIKTGHDTSYDVSEPEPEPETPSEAKVLATFTLGANGSASHNDGTSKTTYSETVNGYTLSITNGTNFYTGARDAKGNGCFKLGTSSKAGSFSIIVPENVTSVKIYIAAYKAKTATITVNGNATTLTTKSDNGQYDEIIIDTTSTKTINLSVSSGYRAMVNTIEFIETSK